MKKILLITTAVFSLSTYSADLLPSCHNWNDGSSDTVKAAIAAATAENKKAAKVGFEWRDTVKFIKKATKLSATPCNSSALTMANMAKAQALDAQKQAKDQANAGPSF